MTVFEIVVILLIQLFFLPLLIRKARKHTLSPFDVIFIIIIDGFLCLFMIYPRLFTYLSEFFGIGRGVDVFVYFGLIILSYVVFRLYFKLEKVREEITRLNRELSIHNSIELGVRNEELGVGNEELGVKKNENLKLINNPLTPFDKGEFNSETQNLKLKTQNSEPEKEYKK